MFILPMAALFALAPHPADGGIVYIKGRQLLAEVARSAAERRRLLAFRNLFKAERCMFVVPPDAGLHPVQTAKFLLPFDVIWVDEMGTIVEAIASIPPCSAGKSCLSHGGIVVSRYHVFLQAGMIRRLGIRVGDHVGWAIHFQDGSRLKGNLSTSNGSGPRKDAIN